MYNQGEKVDQNILSGGERDRLNIAITLAMNTRSKFLIMDEILSSVDETASKIVSNLQHYARKTGKIVILTSHLIINGGVDRELNVESLRAA